MPKIIAWIFIIAGVPVFCLSAWFLSMAVAQDGLKVFVYQSDSLGSAIIELTILLGIILPLVMISAGVVRLREKGTEIFKKILIVFASLFALYSILISILPRFF